MQPLWLKQSVD
jgi:hypothetical protein